MTHSPSQPLKFFRRALPVVALALSAGFASAPAWAQTAAPRAGTSIGNQATATYSDGSNIPRNVQSNSVTTTIQQVAAVDLTDPRAISAAPGAPISFSHTIQNNGNGTDTFNIAVAELANDQFNIGFQIFADANQDGVADNNTPITVTPSLQPGEKFNFVVVGSVPATRVSGDVANITVTATSVFDATKTDTNADSVTVSTQAVVKLTKSVSQNSVTPPVAPAGPTTVTYTLRYVNNTNVAATAVTVTDNLNGGLTYATGSGRWNVSGATPLTDAPAGDPAGIDYAYDAGTNTVTATIANVPARTSGQITFGVNVTSAAAPGVYPNSAGLSYNDGAATKTDTSNTVDVTVNQRASLTFNGQTLPVANQGATAVFGVSTVATENLLTNTGNGTDTFDIVVDSANSNNTYPPDTVFQLFQSDNAATLLDTNGNGIPDTGPIPAGGTYRVVLRAILPADSAKATASSVDLIATSNAATRPVASAKDIVSVINAAAVELTNDNATGTDQGTGALTATPVTTLTGAPGTTQTFTLRVKNLTGGNDNYSLSYSTTNAFTPATTLPAGFTVTFRSSTGAVITNTGNVATGTPVVVTAEVFIPAGAAPAPYDLYFRVLSGSTGATDVKLDRVVVSAVRSITITPNNNGQVFPGSSVNYSHTVTNTGNQSETIALTSANNRDGFSSVIYFDADNDGQLSDAELARGPITSTGTLVGNVFTPGPLAAGGTFRIIVKVFGPSSEFQSGQANQTVVTADATGGITATATDTTTIVAGDVLLEKLQKVYNADGTPVNAGAPTKGSATALPGQLIRYTIRVTNTGGAPVSNIVVRDNTPAFTTYSTGNGTTTPAGVAVVTIDGGTTFTAVPAANTPANGASGTLTVDVGTLAPNAIATISFNVKING